MKLRYYKDNIYWSDSYSREYEFSNIEQLLYLEPVLRWKNHIYFVGYSTVQCSNEERFLTASIVDNKGVRSVCIGFVPKEFDCI